MDGRPSCVAEGLVLKIITLLVAWLESSTNSVAMRRGKRTDSGIHRVLCMLVVASLISALLRKGAVERDRDLLSPVFCIIRRERLV